MTNVGSANQAWLQTLELVKDSKNMVAPRDMTTRELIHHTTQFKMDYPIVYEKKRGLSYTFMAAEALWILNGSDRLDFHPEIRHKLGPYSDDGETLFGAYGPRIAVQLGYVVVKLMQDKDTRQAVIELWKPMPEPSKDIPCTVAMQFLIREGKLHLNVFMRSSDVWMGLPYDMFSFSCVAQKVAAEFAVKMGVCSITAGSSHLYYKDFKEANEVIYQPRIAPTMFVMPTKRSIIPTLQVAANAQTQLEALETLLGWKYEKIG